jgi:hypothetical protein
MSIILRTLNEENIREKAKQDFETFISWMIDPDVYTFEDEWSDDTLELLEFATEEEQRNIRWKIINGEI